MAIESIVDITDCTATLTGRIIANTSDGCTMEADYICGTDAQVRMTEIRVVYTQ